MRRYIPGACLLVADAPKPPVHRRSFVRCTSRRWRLLARPCWAGKGPNGPPLGERTTAAGSTTARLRVVSKCALRRGLAKRMERPGHPRTLPLGFLLLVDHRLFSLCHSATNEPPANVYLGGETTLYTIHLKIISQKAEHPNYSLITLKSHSISLRLVLTATM